LEIELLSRHLPIDQWQECDRLAVSKPELSPEQRKYQSPFALSWSEEQGYE